MDFNIFSLSGFIICISYFFAGIVDSISGGGGLLSLSAFMIVGFPVHYIVGTNQLVGPVGAFISTLQFARRGHIDWTIGLSAMPAAIIGSFLGARLNLLVPAEYLQWIMVIMIPIVAFAVLFKPDLGNVNRSGEYTKSSLIIRSFLIGITIGVYQGFYGAGSGTFYMLCFAFFTGLDLIRATGTTRFVAFICMLTGAITYTVSGAVYWQMAALAVWFNIAGSYIGAELTMTKGAKLIRPMYIVILVLLMIRLFATLIF